MWIRLACGQMINLNYCVCIVICPKTDSNDWQVLAYLADGTESKAAPVIEDTKEACHETYERLQRHLGVFDLLQRSEVAA